MIWDDSHNAVNNIAECAIRPTACLLWAVWAS